MVEIPTFLKWAGGKSQMIEKYEPYFPKKFKRYFEPFVGGGAVYFYLKLTRGIKNGVLSDINGALINIYREVKEHPHEIIEILKEHKKGHFDLKKVYYYMVRDHEPQIMTPVAQAARLIYLNRTCFNGLYRVNSKGRFNVPMGDYNRPSIVREDTILEASRLLVDAEIHVRQFWEVLDHAKKGDFVYFDPPYYPLSKTSSFTSYQSSPFGDKEHKKLAKVFKELDERGCYIMLSNSSAPQVLKLFKGHDEKGFLHLITARRAISCNPSTRGPVKEVLVVNYPS